MDEQNLETKPAIINPLLDTAQPLESLTPPIPPVKKRGKFGIILLLALAVIVMGVVGFVVSKQSKKSANLDQPAPQKIYVSDITTKNEAGIILPIQGFPMELLIEPKAQPTINQTEYSADGKSLTATRKYQSQLNIYFAYLSAKDYLVKKNWLVVEVVAPNATGQGQSELELSAKKDAYEASLNFKSSGEYAIVTIIAKSVTK